MEFANTEVWRGLKLFEEYLLLVRGLEFIINNSLTTYGDLILLQRA